MGSNWKIPENKIDEIMDGAEYDCRTVFDCCTVVSMKLPNGYVLTEESGCVDPAEYDEQLGIALCKDALKRKVWQMEGYLQKERFANRSEPEEAKDIY